MSCGSSEAFFEGYLDDTLLPAQRARLLRHLNRCGRCKGVLDELRVVDALLAYPRQIELPPNFTFATMAEVRSLPKPQVSSQTFLLAYVVSYLVAAWLLIGAGFVLASSTMRALGDAALDEIGMLVHAIGAIGTAGARVLGDFGSLTAFIGGAIVFDVALALVIGFTIVRPRLAKRVRS